MQRLSFNYQLIYPEYFAKHVGFGRGEKPSFMLESSCYTYASSRTLTASWVINCIVVQSPAVAQFVQAFVVVCCSVTGTHWILVGRAVFVTHTASFMGTERFANSK